jgi:hypothetical protein
MSEDTKADLKAVLELAVQDGAVAVQSYQRTSPSGTSFQVSAATRGAPGPKNGITNPGGAIRSTLSTGRQSNEAGREVGEAMGSRNTVTVGSSGIGRSPLTPYTASSTPNPNASGYQAAAAKASAAGAQVQATAIANQAAVAAAKASAASTAKTSSPFVTYPKTAKTAKPFITYPKTAKSYTSSSYSKSSTSDLSKVSEALRAADVGLRLGRLATRPDRLLRGAGGNGVGSALRNAAQKARDTASRTASRDAKDTAERDARDTAERDARDTAERDARRTAEKTAERTAHNTMERDLREHAERDADKAGSDAEKEVTSLSVSDILDLQIALSRKGYPVRIDGRLSMEFLTVVDAYLKATE